MCPLQSADSLALWYKCLAHLSVDSVHYLANMVDGMIITPDGFDSATYITYNLLVVKD